MAEFADDHLRRRAARSQRPAHGRDRRYLRTATREAPGTRRNHASAELRARGRAGPEREASQSLEAGRVEPLTARRAEDPHSARRSVQALAGAVGFRHGPSAPISAFAASGPQLPRLVFLDRRGICQDRLHDAPLGVDRVCASEQLVIAAHRVAEQALIWRHVRPGALHQR